jgi:tRNA pseudouridine55 synthase
MELLDLGGVEAGRRAARMAVRCGKGTYVRTLAADLGRALGIPAHLAALRRTQASGFTLDQALPLEEAEALVRAEGPEALRARLIPPAEALGFLPVARLTPGEALDLAHGRKLAAPPGLSGLARALDPASRLVAVCTAEGGWLRPVRVLLTPAELAR